jgi:anti-sigma factor RsiW
MKQYPSDEMLNAYVDGELSPEDDARVAEAIAQFPSLAARVATLSQVKSTLSGLAVTPPQRIHIPRSRWSKAMLAAAASLTFFLVVMSGLISKISDPAQDQDYWYRVAAATHAQWVLEPARPNAKEVDANLYLASADRLNLPIRAPDLTSARLRLTYLQFYDAEGEMPAAMHLGYTGRHGCRLSLWITAAPAGLSKDLAEIREGPMRSFRWRAGKVAYALFATGMAEQRFTMIADKVYQATRARKGFNDETRTALNEVSRRAPPCAA